MFDDLLAIGIIIWFVLWVIAKYSKKTIGEVIKDLLEFLKDEEVEE